MMEIEMPKIAVEENEEKSYAKIVVEPLEKGFGLTIGNCLRRILLSALPGAAITNVKFAEGVKHEFTAIPARQGGRDGDHSQLKVRGYQNGERRQELQKERQAL